MNNTTVEDMSFNEPWVGQKLNPTTKAPNSSRPRYCLRHDLHIRTLDSRTSVSQFRAHSETLTAKTTYLCPSVYIYYPSSKMSISNEALQKVRSEWITSPLFGVHTAHANLCDCSSCRRSRRRPSRHNSRSMSSSRK